MIAINRAQGSYTLALLDLDPTGEGIGGQVPMQPKDAANAMFLMAEKLEISSEEMSDESTFDKLKIEACKKICEEIGSLMVVLCSDMGTPEQNITYLPLSKLSSAKVGRLHCLVIPANLGDVEDLAVRRWGKEEQGRRLRHYNGEAGAGRVSWQKSASVCVCAAQNKPILILKSA